MLKELWDVIKTVLKQDFCVHDYVQKTYDIGISTYTTKTCKKCGYIKVVD